MPSFRRALGGIRRNPALRRCNKASIHDLKCKKFVMLTHAENGFPGSPSPLPAGLAVGPVQDGLRYRSTPRDSVQTVCGYTELTPLSQRVNYAAMARSGRDLGE